MENQKKIKKITILDLSPDSFLLEEKEEDKIGKEEFQEEVIEELLI